MSIFSRILSSQAIDKKGRTSMEEYNVYIDESGDEGIKKGSKYFILTALIVKKENDLKIAKNVDIIKQNLEMNIKSRLH